MEYTKEYFIEKFTKLTNDEVGIGLLSNHCALWHCGVRENPENKHYVPTEESTALIKLFGGDDENQFKVVTRINDASYVGNITPRERILNRLKSIN